MQHPAELDMRLRTAELALIQARRRRAAVTLLPCPANRHEVVAQLKVHAEVCDQERRATAERVRALRGRYLPELVA